jgi:Fe-S oxidoreductase
MMWRDLIQEKCKQCKACRKECAFLQKYGEPGAIAGALSGPDGKGAVPAWDCNLCGLCAAVCPSDLQPARMFLEMRRDAHLAGGNHLREYSRILNFEKRGTSERYSLCAIPDACDTVFFPGCALPGTRPDKVMRLFEQIRTKIPSLGIVLDCCTKPSHDLGREEHFDRMFGELKKRLFKNGVRNILVACPSCHQVFREHAGEFHLSTVYEFLAEEGIPDLEKVSGEVSIQDACTVRFESHIHDAVRTLVEGTGLKIKERAHTRQNTMCCGEGGSAAFAAPHFANRWRDLIKEEAGGKLLVAYCAGCASRLNRVTPTIHLLDLLFEPGAAVSGKVKASRSPITYWNRVRLKNRFKKLLMGSAMPVRTFSPSNRNG